MPVDLTIIDNIVATDYDTRLDKQKWEEREKILKQEQQKVTSTQGILALKMAQEAHLLKKPNKDLKTKNNPEKRYDGYLGLAFTFAEEAKEPVAADTLTPAELMQRQANLSFASRLIDQELQLTQYKGGQGTTRQKLMLEAMRHTDQLRSENTEAMGAAAQTLLANKKEAEAASVLKEIMNDGYERLSSSYSNTSPERVFQSLGVSSARVLLGSHKAKMRVLAEKSRLAESREELERIEQETNKLEKETADGFQSLSNAKFDSANYHANKQASLDRWKSVVSQFQVGVSGKLDIKRDGQTRDVDSSGNTDVNNSGESGSLSAAFTKLALLPFNVPIAVATGKRKTKQLTLDNAAARVQELKEYSKNETDEIRKTIKSRQEYVFTNEKIQTKAEQSLSKLRDSETNLKEKEQKIDSAFTEVESQLKLAKSQLESEIAELDNKIREHEEKTTRFEISASKARQGYIYGKNPEGDEAKDDRTVLTQEGRRLMNEKDRKQRELEAKQKEEQTKIKERNEARKIIEEERNTIKQGAEQAEHRLKHPGRRALSHRP